MTARKKKGSHWCGVSGFDSRLLSTFLLSSTVRGVLCVKLMFTCRASMGGLLCATAHISTTCSRMVSIRMIISWRSSSRHWMITCCAFPCARSGPCVRSFTAFPILSGCMNAVSSVMADTDHFIKNIGFAL